MGSSSDRDWLQIVGLVGIISGLMLVAYEVRQTNKFAQAEAIRAMYEGWDSVQIQSFSSDIFDIYIKSFKDPDGLSDAEIMKMDAWLTVQMNQCDSRMVMQKMGLNPYDTVQGIEVDFDYYFGNSFGRAWFSRNKYWMEAELVEAIEQQMANRPIRPPHFSGS